MFEVAEPPAQGAHESEPRTFAERWADRLERAAAAGDPTKQRMPLPIATPNRSNASS